MDEDKFIRALAIHAAITSRFWESDIGLTERADRFAVCIQSYVDGSMAEIFSTGERSLPEAPSQVASS